MADNAEVYDGNPSANRQIGFSDLLRTLTGRSVSVKFEKAGGNAARKIRPEKRMFSRTLLLGLLVLSLTGGGS